jgi:uncharacterized protein with ATP-grasp and redox domains
MGRIIHRYVKEVSNNSDPYKEVKEKFNNAAKLLCDELQLEKFIESSEDPFGTAVRIAIAGNIIDFGVTSSIDENKVKETVEACLEADIKGNASRELMEAVYKAKKILYLGDNAGEIVFDKLLIKRLPCEKITFVVKGEPIINDATMEDAEKVGMTELVNVIDNGADIPGTILRYCSLEFREKFEEADLIISKGQGNYETLSEISNKKIFFLLKAKCPVIAEDLQCQVGDIVLKCNQK